ncbi:MAG: FAD-dependent oxidoreductase [Anaerolineae bacterium]
MTTNSTDYDVAIVGGGIIGTAILWELAHFDLRLLLVERGDDVACGSSKANSGIAHCGFDAHPSTLEARLVVGSNPRFPEICALLQVPYQPCGALMLALSDEDLRRCEAVLEEARLNGVTDVRPLRADEVLALEPQANPGVRGGLLIPRESITDSARLAIAYAESGVLNGAEVALNEAVQALQPLADGVQVTTTRRTVRACWAINAAGLFADEIARMVGDESFTISPRKGEFYILDRRLGGLLQHILLPVPSATTKGILAAPTVDGNLLLGPTADDVSDKCDTATTNDGLERVAAGVRRLAPSLDPDRHTITQYAGLRPVCSTNRFEVRPSERCPRLVHAAGIRSTGLSASPEVAAMVRDLLADQGLILRPRPGYRAERPAIPRMRAATGEEPAALHARDARYGHMVCRCEQVSEAEVVQAIHAPIPATSLEAIKRRLHAGAGRCQGGFCGPRILEILARELMQPLPAVRKAGPGSEVLREPNKARWCDVERVSSVNQRSQAKRAGTRMATAPPPSLFVSSRFAPRVSRIMADVAVVGAGPAGLAAALSAWEQGARRVLLLDREEEPGGILKQCIHSGFGLQYFQADLTGPEYAQRFWRRLAGTGVDYRPGAMVTGLEGTDLRLFSEERGAETVAARAVVLATGCRERTRGNLRIPGTRPAGVLTAGTVQRLVNLCGYLPGRQAVVLGSGDIGLIMARRLTLEGAQVLRVVEILPYAAALPRNVVQCLQDFGIPLQLHSTVTRIVGSPRLQAVEIADLASGQVELVECDLLMLSVGLICENDLVVAAGVEMDPLTGGPLVDDRCALSQPGLYAAGNSLHVSDLVDTVSLEGERAGAQAAAYALGESPPIGRRIRVLCGEGVRQVVPQFVTVEPDAGTVRLSLRVQHPLAQARIHLWEGSRRLATHRERAVVPASLIHWEVERSLLAQVGESCRLSAEGETVCREQGGD